MGKVFGKLAGITGWFVGFVREVSRGIAVGRLRSGTASQWDGFAVGRGWYGPVVKHGRTSVCAGGFLRREACIDGWGGLMTVQTAVEARVRQRKKWNAGG